MQGDTSGHTQVTRVSFPTDVGAETKGWIDATKRHIEERVFQEAGTAGAKALR